MNQGINGLTDIKKVICVKSYLKTLIIGENEGFYIYSIKFPHPYSDWVDQCYIPVNLSFIAK